MVYLGALNHSWAFDDGPIIQSNPAAHSIPAAAAAFFSSYWPSDQTTSGQYRPLTVLSFAIDWSLSNGSTTWFHLVNVMLHGTATALFVLVVSAWLSPLGALIAGLVFAVHPVHVEAVANVVGRAEVLVAAGVFACVLAARQYRRTSDRRTQATWFALALLLLLTSLLVKEHAVITVAVILLDHILDPAGNRRQSLTLYIGLVAVTLGWFYLWHSIAGQYVSVSVAATIRGLSFFDRLGTMLVAQLHVVRLLVWPMELSADYNPQIIPRLEHWSWLSTVGLLTSSAMLTLAVALRRRVPAITFGIGLAAVSYAPTSNLLFPSGVILSERNLYLAVAAPCVVLGWLAMRLSERTRSTFRQRARPVLTAVVLGLLVVYSGRTVSRVPFWKDGETVLLMDFVQHPENYRARLRVGGFLRARGDLPGALAEANTAGAVFTDDPWTAQYSVVRALDLGVPHLALREARRAHMYEPENPSFARLVVRARLALGHFDSAAVVARRSVLDAPSSPIAMRSYVEVLDSLAAPDWKRQVALARWDYVEAKVVGASAHIDSALSVLPDSLRPDADCWDVFAAAPLFASLNPRAMGILAGRIEPGVSECRTVQSGSESP